MIASIAGVVERVNKFVTVRPLRARYTGDVGDVVVGRVLSVQQSRWKVDIHAKQDAVLLLSSINLPGDVRRRRTVEDQLQMRSFFQENDLISVFHPVSSFAFPTLLLTRLLFQFRFSHLFRQKYSSSSKMEPCRFTLAYDTGNWKTECSFRFLRTLSSVRNLISIHSGVVWIWFIIHLCLLTSLFYLTLRPSRAKCSGFGHEWLHLALSSQI